MIGNSVNLKDFDKMPSSSNYEEEITRLKSHISQFRKLIEENGPVGKKLDFLIQEMNRETNTIGSKANNVSKSNVY